MDSTALLTRARARWGDTRRLRGCGRRPGRTRPARAGAHSTGRRASRHPHRHAGTSAPAAARQVDAVRPVDHREAGAGRVGAYARAVVSGGTGSGGRGHWLFVVVVLGLAGAAAGAWAGWRVMPEERAVAVSLAVAGFGLGGLVAMVGLAFRALLMRAARALRRSRDAAVPTPLAAQDAPPEPPGSLPAAAPEAEREPAADEPESAAVPGPVPAARAGAGAPGGRRGRLVSRPAAARRPALLGWADLDRPRLARPRAGTRPRLASVAFSRLSRVPLATPAADGTSAGSSASTTSSSWAVRCPLRAIASSSPRVCASDASSRPSSSATSCSVASGWAVTSAARRRSTTVREPTAQPSSASRSASCWRNTPIASVCSPRIEACAAAA